MGGRVCSLYIEYIIKEYKGKQRCGARGKECAGKSVPLLYIDIV